MAVCERQAVATKAVDRNNRTNVKDRRLSAGRGRWRTLIIHFPLEGPERREEAEWTFGYALEGREVIDGKARLLQDVVGYLEQQNPDNIGVLMIILDFIGRYKTR